MRNKANRILAIIFLIFAIGVLAVGITWSGEVKTSMKDTELRLAEIQQNIDASADNSIISGSVENYNQNVKVYNSYLDMYDMGFKLIMTLSIADLVVVIIDDMTYLVLSYGDSLIQIPIYDLKNERPFQQLGMLIGAIKHKGNKLRFKRISLKPQENDKKFNNDDLSSQLNLPIN